MAITALDKLTDKVLEAHEAYYDVRRGYDYAGMQFAGYAELHAETSQYVLTKQAKLWEAHTHDYLFFAKREALDLQEVDRLVAFMKTNALEKVKPEQDHMTSYLTLIILAGTADCSALTAVEKARFRKNYAWGLKGWADLRVAVVDLSCERVVTNVRAREMASLLESICKSCKVDERVKEQVAGAS